MLYFRDNHSAFFTLRETIVVDEIDPITCQCERTILDVKAVFDAKMQIAGLFFVPSRAAGAR